MRHDRDQAKSIGTHIHKNCPEVSVDSRCTYTVVDHSNRLLKVESSTLSPVDLGEEVEDLTLEVSLERSCLLGESLSEENGT